jgi:hypothetical protein
MARLAPARATPGALSIIVKVICTGGLAFFPSSDRMQNYIIVKAVFYHANEPALLYSG